MLPILVLLVASSALAAAGVINVNQVSSNDLSYGENTLVGNAFTIFDSGDATVNQLNVGAVLRDLSRNGANPALANGQAVAILGELATGRAGDACAAANYINAYTRYVASGNSAGVREALGNYIQALIINVDNIIKLATNKDAARYSSGSRGGCAGEGKAYQIDAAWDIILGSAAPNQQSIINEEYCIAKRLYCGLSASNVNSGAHLTATALPPTQEVFKIVNAQLTNFLQRVPAKDSVAQSGAALKQALTSAVSRVTL